MLALRRVFQKFGHMNKQPAIIVLTKETERHSTPDALEQARRNSGLDQHECG